MRRAAKVDANHVCVVDALRKAGASVLSLAAVGKGCPDLIVGFQGKTVLMEVKNGANLPSKRRLTEDQKDWHMGWRGGTLAVVCDVESALRVLGVMKGSA